MHDQLPLEGLRTRARILEGIRAFFAPRGVLEVEVPVLGRGGVADATLEPLATRAEGLPGGPAELYLLTSPEVFMKRLLAAGSGPIYTLTRAFRAGEVGARHNLEFTILEWYRPGWSVEELRDEVAALLAHLLPALPPAVPRDFGEAFREAVGLDPFTATAPALRARLEARGVSLPPGMPDDDPAPWIDLALGELVEPMLAAGPPTFLCDWPPGRAALARVRPGDPPVEERFELYAGGLELANGFAELTDAAEQRRRFEAVNAARVAAGRPALALDERFLEALGAMPDAAGVAVGVDRLAMLAAGTEDLAEVTAFPYARL